jgi:hypothetical protein
MKLHLHGLNIFWKSGSRVGVQKMLQQSPSYYIVITSMTELNNMLGLLDVVNKESPTSFL